MCKGAWIAVGLALGAASRAGAGYEWTYFIEGDELVSEWALERTAEDEDPIIPIPEPSGLLVFAAGLLTIRRAARCARSC